MAAQRGNDAAWGVVVPVKHLDVAKSRLSAYGESARRDLALAFAVDVVRAALDCPAVREVLRAADPALGVVTVSADLPALSPQDLAAALAAVPAGGRAFVADSAGSGTTLLAAAAPSSLLPSYGAGSSARHRASGALELPGTPALRRDVDTPADLREAVALGVGTRTAAVAAGLPALP